MEFDTKQSRSQDREHDEAIHTSPLLPFPFPSNFPPLSRLSPVTIPSFPSGLCFPLPFFPVALSSFSLQIQLGDLVDFFLMTVLETRRRLPNEQLSAIAVPNPMLGSILCKMLTPKSSGNVANYSVQAAAVFQLTLTVCICCCC